MPKKSDDNAQTVTPQEIPMEPTVTREENPRAGIPALFIRSVSKRGFRRCGFEFTAEGYGIALSALTEAQIAILKSEPKLVVQDTELAD